MFLNIREMMKERTLIYEKDNDSRDIWPSLVPRSFGFSSAEIQLRTSGCTTRGGDLPISHPPQTISKAWTNRNTLNEKIVRTCLIKAVCVCSVAQSQSCPTLCDPVNPPGSSVHRDSPGKNTGVICHALLQGIFPTQGSNPGFLHWQV